MKTTSISSASISTGMQLTVQNSQVEIAKLQTESVTGTYADVGLELGTRTSTSIDYSRETARLQSITDANSLAEQRMSQSQLALTQISDSAQSLLDSNVALSGSSDSSSLQVASDTATSMLENFVSYANASINGEYIFSGINTDAQTVDDSFISDVTSDFNTAFEDFKTANGIVSNDEVSGEQMTTFLSDYSETFDWSSYTNASDTAMTSRISTSETVATSTSANSDGFKNLVLSALMTSQLVNSGLNSDALASLNTQATSLAGLAISGVTSQASLIGLSQERVEKANEAMSAQMSIIDTQLSGLVGVDTYDASVRLNTLLTQVETSYTITAKIQELSLVNFL
jgi:flagellar hook-associated protein 3 FlgL